VASVTGISASPAGIRTGGSHGWTATSRGIYDRNPIRPRRSARDGKCRNGTLRNIGI
jgi:hypothetical protein